MSEAQDALQEQLAELLTQGCDDRIVINPATGMHKYNGTNRPVPGSVRRSSCTFSVPTEDSFANGLAAVQRVQKDSAEIEVMRRSICERLTKLWMASGAALAMFPSGTDSELLPLLVALGRALRLGGKMASIITCAGEVGSGTTQAATGRHFSSMLPKPHMWKEVHEVGGSLFAADGRPEIDAIELKLRGPDGSRMRIEDLDNSVSRTVDEALTQGGYAVVSVHMVVGCKTGHLMPSLACMEALLCKYGEQVVPVADACQARMVDTGLQDLVSSGFAVLATGSKFYGGPPFSGVVLLPEAMVSELNAALAADAPGDLHGKVAASSLRAYISAGLVPPELPALKAILPGGTPNLGLLIRWQMALFNIEGYHAIPGERRHALEVEWMTETIAMIGSKGLRTVTVFKDESAASDSKPNLKRRTTLMCKEASGMLPDATIILLDLKKLAPDGAVAPCTLAEMKHIHNLMARDLSGSDGVVDSGNPAWSCRCFLAQPVSLAKDVHVIRIAIGAPLVLRLHEGSDRDKVRSEDIQLIDKLNLILCSWDSLPA